MTLIAMPGNRVIFCIHDSQSDVSGIGHGLMGSSNPSVWTEEIIVVSEREIVRAPISTIVNTILRERGTLITR